MNEDKNLSNSIVSQIKKKVYDRCVGRPNPLQASSEEVKIYIDKFFNKMDKLLPRKSIDENK
jgi:hypothetical protein